MDTNILMWEGDNLMTYEEIVSKVQRHVVKCKADHIGEHIAIQMNIYGEGEGAFYIEINNGQIVVMPYEYYDRDAVVYVDAETLFGILSAELPIESQTCNGKLVIQGRHDATISVLKSLIVQAEEKTNTDKKVDKKTDH